LKFILGKNFAKYIIHRMRITYNKKKTKIR